MTVKRLEAKAGIVAGTVDTVLRVQRALEKFGVIFIAPDSRGGPGVRLARPKSTTRQE
jgi:hypothetical protein